jgi:hypothetical protein
MLKPSLLGRVGDSDRTPPAVRDIIALPGEVGRFYGGTEFARFEDRPAEIEANVFDGDAGVTGAEGFGVDVVNESPSTAGPGLPRCPPTADVVNGSAPKRPACIRSGSGARGDSTS